MRLSEKTLSGTVGEASDLMERIDHYIDSNLEYEISVQDLAGLSGFSEVHFRRQFKKITGISPNQYVAARRMDAARRMLIESSDSITDIAYNLGFSSSQYFASFFKKMSSFTPRDYRNSARRLIEVKGSSGAVSAREASAWMDQRLDS